MNQATSPAAELQEFVEFWKKGLVKVLDQISGGGFRADTASPSAPPAASPNDLSLLVVSAGNLRGEMWFLLPATTVVGFAQLLLAETLDPAAACKPEHSEAAAELLRQVTGQVASDLKARWGELQVRVDTAPAPPAWASAAEGWLSLAAGEKTMWLEYKISAALGAGLRPSAPAPTEAKESASESTLELLMDVELEASLRFGGRQMLLREILELDAGSVVELDREVQQAADLLLDGKLIARGEVVVVGGNYGLRITEVTPLAAAAGRRP